VSLPETILLAAERAALIGATGAALAAIPPWRRRRMAGAISFSLALVSMSALAWHFLADDFSYRLVWLLSAPELAPWLKLASLWASDSGTLLLLGLIASGLALRLARRDGFAGPGAVLLAAIFLASALIFDPFRQTPPELLAQMPHRGMNAHLTRIWMALHPPLVFLAYMLIVAPWGAMAEALATGRGAWRDIAAVQMRLSFLILSAGIALGMWWAYEDFAYGTLWHWDPVQTAIFAAWAFLTGLVHAQRRYRPVGPFAMSHPALGLLAAIAALGAMAITREPTLVSSHRYVGETSAAILFALTSALAAVLVAAIVYRLARGPRLRLKTGGERSTALVVAVALFAVLGLAALAQIAIAYASALMELPRPKDLKPFFEMLRNFAPAREIDALRTAFAQWDIDIYGMNRWLAPLTVLIGLTGGHYFMPLARRWRWAATGLAIAACLAAAFWLHPFAHWYEGTGLTSGKTVALFPWLDALLASTAYLALAAATAGFRAARAKDEPRSLLGYDLPVALIHLGVMVALLAGLAATVLDSYAQRFVTFPEALNRPISFPDGYALTVDVVSASRKADGARAADGQPAFRSVATVGWTLERHGAVIGRETGHTVYRDARPPAETGLGAVRLMCEMIDYRYARYRSGDTQIIHPLISRGLLSDVQIWFPAVSGAAPGEGRAPVVLKVFPLLSWVWIGLAAAGAGALWFFIAEMARRRRRRVTRL